MFREKIANVYERHGLLAGLWRRTFDTETEIRRLVQCGAQRCLLYRTLGSVDLLLRCLEQSCAAAFTEAEQNADKGNVKAGDCAAVCEGLVDSKYLECLSQSCGLNQPRAAASFCPSICNVIAPDNVERCLQRYCSLSADQGDQGREIGSNTCRSWTKNIRRKISKTSHNLGQSKHNDFSSGGGGSIVIVVENDRSTESSYAASEKNLKEQVMIENVEYQICARS